MRMARHSIWARAKHRTGLERPHLWQLSAAQRLRGVAPAHALSPKVRVMRTIAIPIPY
jgi:hypothetical protein